MKTVLLFIFLMPLAAIGQNFHISASLAELNDGDKIYFSYREDGVLYKDSAVAKDHAFQFSGNIKAPAKGSLTARENPFSDIEVVHDALNFYVEPGETLITGADSLKHATATGTVTNADYFTLLAQLRTYQQKLININAAFERLSPEEQKKVENVAANRKAYYDVLAEMAPVKFAFAKSHPDSYVSFIALRDMLNQADAAAINTAFEGLSERLRTSPGGAAFAKTIASAVKTRTGIMAPVFSLPDAGGRQVTLAGYKGKYVLVDFWASWCMPCRMENPHVKAAYNRYKAKNFTVLSVSIDSKEARNAWLKAVKTDGLPWTQVQDASQKVHDQYGVTYIPANFLIDPTGKIIAKNLRDTALMEKLEEVLGK